MKVFFSRLELHFCVCLVSLFSFFVLFVVSLNCCIGFVVLVPRIACTVFPYCMFLPPGFIVSANNVALISLFML